MSNTVKQGMKKNNIIALRIDENMFQKLEARQMLERREKSEILREAIARYLNLPLPKENLERKYTRLAKKVERLEVVIQEFLQQKYKR